MSSTTTVILNMFNLHRVAVFSRWMALALGFITATGCISTPMVVKQLYPGPRLPESQEARFIIPEGTRTSRFQLNAEWCIVTSMDGQGSGWSVWKEIRLKPGKHVVKIRWEGTGIWSDQTKWFVAEAGEEYIPKFLVSDVRNTASGKKAMVRIWIENKRTGKIVGGNIGSDDEPQS